MKKSEILFEPLPIGRMGFRRDTEEVIVAQDFSCFAHMLEEYISFGAVDIVMPRSAPEIATFDEMPALLLKRIRVVNDEDEIEAVQRLLFNLRKEFDVKTSDDNDHLTFPAEMPMEMITSIGKAHSDIKRMALGFNNNIQIDINPTESITSLKYLRGKSSDQQTRVILAQIESLLNSYSDIDFEALVPPKNSTPKELVSIFDRLINDDNYLEYSNSIAQLSIPSTRNQALIRLREVERILRKKDYISTGWNYLSKIIKVGTGVPVPESSAIANIINNRTLPPLVDLKQARDNAVEIWKKSELKNTPLRRDGKPVADDNIYWLPPLGSVVSSAPGSGPFKFGTVSELKNALDDAMSHFDESDNNSKA